MSRLTREKLGSFANRVWFNEAFSDLSARAAKRQLLGRVPAAQAVERMKLIGRAVCANFDSVRYRPMRQTRRISGIRKMIGSRVLSR